MALPNFTPPGYEWIYIAPSYQWILVNERGAARVVINKEDFYRFDPLELFQMLGDVMERYTSG